jgi:hypothetical protein
VSNLFNFPLALAEEFKDGPQRRERDAYRLAQGDAAAGPARPPVWPAGTPTPPELLAQLQPCDPASGRPLDEPAVLGELPFLSTARERRGMERFRAWAQLDARAKSQLVCDLRFTNEGEPQWVVTVPFDGSQPPLVVRAPDEANAQQRYREVCGIRGLDPPKDGSPTMSVTPYVPPADGQGQDE